MKNQHFIDNYFRNQYKNRRNKINKKTLFICNMMKIRVCLENFHGN